MRLLDLFCGAGGAAVGYHRAGFQVVGVDTRSQPNYPYEFIQADAMTFPLDGFDAIHASPPCPHYANVTRWRGIPGNHPALIAPMRDRLNASGLPWVMENVRTRELRADFVLCGTQFGLPVRRHRYFETNWAPLHLLPPCQHRTGDYSFDHGSKQPESVYRTGLETWWMTVRESRDAVPPAYTEWIGHQLAAHLETEATA